jgi:hypothetical protein
VVVAVARLMGLRVTLHPQHRLKETVVAMVGRTLALMHRVVVAALAVQDKLHHQQVSQVMEVMVFKAHLLRVLMVVLAPEGLHQLVIFLVVVAVL